jgi:segregation and condensation protein B
MERSRLKSVLESLLFVAEAPLTVQRLAEVTEGVDKKEILSALVELQSEYEAERRGVRIAEVAGGYQMRTPKENAEEIKRLYQGRPSRMSRATLETLAIIAYKQPLVRTEIEQIRGVDTAGVLRTLLDRRLIRIVGRKDIPGRPIMYGTTKQFLQAFGLKDLGDLPALRDLKDLRDPDGFLLPGGAPMSEPGGEEDPPGTLEPAQEVAANG